MKRPKKKQKLFEKTAIVKQAYFIEQNSYKLLSKCIDFTFCW